MFMGGVLDLPSSPVIDDDKFPVRSDSFVVVKSRTIKNNLYFNPAQSHLVAFGIDKQHHPDFQHKSLGPTVKLDALETCLTFARECNIEEFSMYTASDNPDQCTHAGIKSALESSAQRVGRDGLLVIFFGGHGVNDSNEEWALAPADFDLTPNTYLTTAMLNQCMERANCKAKHILVILDCCYSGAMADSMTKGSSKDNTLLLQNIYVLAAGTAFQSSLGVGTLRHSIFSYFLKHALVLCKSVLGVLPLQSIFEECQACCNALSSLVLSLDNDGKHLTGNVTTPSLSHFSPTSAYEDVDIGFAPSPGRLVFVMELLDKHRYKPSPSLHPATFQWLRELVQYAPSPLSVLDDKGLLDDAVDSGRVLKAAIALMMQSIAYIELVNNRTSVNHPAVFLVAFVHTIATIDLASVNSSLPIDIQHLLEGWPLYHNVLVKNGIDDSSLQALYEEMKVMKDRNTQ